MASIQGKKTSFRALAPPPTASPTPLTLFKRSLSLQQRNFGSAPALNLKRGTTPTASDAATAPSNKGTTTPPEVTETHLNETVYISGIQQGTLRYYGETKFQPGLWCGIELPFPQGKNDGSVGGVRYFKCSPNYGIFAPLQKVTLCPLYPQVEGQKGPPQRLSLGAMSKSDSSAKLEEGEAQVVPESNAPKGKRPQEVRNGTFIVHSAGSGGGGSGGVAEQKRRRIDPDTKIWNADSYKKLGVKVPNFSQINMINLRDEMERSASIEKLSGNPPTSQNVPPQCASTPKILTDKDKGPGDKPFQVEQRKGSLITSQDKGWKKEVALGRSQTFTIIMDNNNCPTHHHDTDTSTFSLHRANRPNNLVLGGSDDGEEGLISEDLSETGLFGQSTPELSLGLSSIPTSPEEAGIQDESSLGTPSHLLDMDDELYRHLRSPSIDNLHLDDDEEEDTVDHDLTTSTHPLAHSDPLPPPPEKASLTISTSSTSATDHGVDTSISAYDSDFNTESEADPCDHHHTPQAAQNRNARIIDGALYTQDPSSTNSSQHCKETITSTSESGFYSSSSSSSSLPRHHSSKSGSDCESIDHTLLCDSSPNKSQDSSDSSSFNETIKTDESSSAVGDMPPPPPLKVVAPPSSTKKKSIDDLHLGGRRLQQLRQDKLRSQSVSCLNSGMVKELRAGVTRVKTANAPSVLQETVASAGRRSNSSVASNGSTRSRFGGSTRSLASSIGSTNKSPPLKKANKWDQVMRKIHEGKTVKINVKDVKSKVFDRVGGVGPVVGGEKRLQRMDSTSSECSEAPPQRTNITTTTNNNNRHRGQARRQISNLSTESDCSKLKVISSPAPTKKKMPVRTPPTVISKVPGPPQVVKVSKGKDKGSSVTTTKRGDIPTLSSRGAAAPTSPPQPQVTTNSKPVPNPAPAAVTTRQKKEVKPLKDQNRVIKPPKETKVKQPSTTTSTSTSTTTSTTTTAPRRRTKDEKELETENTSLKEQLSTLCQELERLKTNEGSKDGEISRLLEHTTQLRWEVGNCALKLQGMSIVVQNFEQKNQHVSEQLKAEKQLLAQLELQLGEALSSRDEALHQLQVHERRLREEEDKLCTAKSLYEEKLTAQAAQHRQELEKLKDSHQEELRSTLNNYRLQRINDSPHDILVKDVASMSAVIELNQKRIKELQIKENLLSIRTEELLTCERELKSATARVEDLEAQLHLLKEEKASLLSREKAAQEALEEALANSSLLQKSVDELSWKMQNPDVIHALPSATVFKEEQALATKPDHTPIPTPITCDHP